jgi:acyl-CoA synthetase (AMP-forming)/AMP-acid ligase II
MSAFRAASYQPLHRHQEVSTSGEILDSAANAFPDKIGLICGERRWTFAKLDALANQLANALLAHLTQDDGPVAIIGANSAEYALTHFAAARTGRLAVNLPTRCTEDEFIYAINLTKPAVLMAAPGAHDIVARVHGRFKRRPLKVSMGVGSALDLGFWDMLTTHPATSPLVHVDPDAGGSVIFTSGTTGSPKAVLSSQRARAISAMAAVEDFRISPETIAGYAVPFTHTAGLFSWFQPAVLAGCTGIVIPKWDPESFMRLTERHRISMTFVVPAQVAMLLDYPGFEPQRLRTLRRFVFGGAPLSRSLIERTESAMPWLSCERAYGSSETGHLAAQIKPDRATVYEGYNQPGGRLEIEIFKAPGIVANEGETGEVATRGAHLMSRYLGDPPATDTFFRSGAERGWGWMGDLAVRNNGYFTLVGRSKHMIISGGLNIFPAEIEDVLGGHPDISDCVVFGVEDSTWGELPAAAVVAKNGAFDVQAVMVFVAKVLARHKRLRRIYVVDEIPRTAGGKPQIHIVKQRCLGMEPRAIA